MPQTPPPLISVGGLTLSTKGASGGRVLLDGVTLTIHQGENLGLIGASGAGKSLLALAMMGLLPSGVVVERGSIAINGKAVDVGDDRAMGQARRGMLGMIFQDPYAALNPIVPVGKQIAEAVRLASTTDKTDIHDIHGGAVADALGQVGLEAAQASRLPHELSGGQRQRVVIAIALAGRAKLLIADEATTALDSITQMAILRLLRNLARQGRITLFLISHDMAVVRYCCGRLAVMAGGRIVDEGAGLNQLRHQASRQLIAASRYTRANLRPPFLGTGAKPAGVLLEVAGVHKNYGKYRGGDGDKDGAVALRDISFTMKHGEMLGLVGASGAGKSTLGRVLLGLEASDDSPNKNEGKNENKSKIIMYSDDGGIAISPRMPNRHRLHISAVFQNPATAFNPRHTIATIIAEPLRLLPTSPTGVARQQLVAAALGQVGLPKEAMTRYPHAFSGGEKQRIAIARALITAPKLIVFDEAVSNLDATIRQHILRLISQLVARQGISGLFISHDLALVHALCHRVMVMAGGRIVEIDDSDQLFAKPRHPSSKALLASVLQPMA